MSERMHALAQLLLGKESIEECDPGEIQKIVSAYPYFSPAQFLWLEKLKQTDHAAYETALQKALLYYHNPLELEYVLSSEKFHTGIDLTDIDVSSEKQIPEADPEPDVLMQEESAPAEPLEIAQKETVSIEEPEPVALEREESAPAEPEEAVVTENVWTAAEPLPDSAPLPEPESLPEPQPLPEPETAQETAHEVLPEPEPEPGPSGLQPLNIKIEERTGEDLAFEPYHTVDYFASQGIKTLLEEKPTDKFGQQVRSFTDWLKVMKKLPATDLTKNIDAGAEQKVENLAAHSVDQSEVVTEAMAEVWLKQGNKQKAIETYNKLSLLNPSKKAYFAARIENLKQP